MNQVIDWLQELNQMLMKQPLLLKIIIGLMLISFVLFSLYLVLSFIFFPIMYLYNHLTDKNQTNVLSKEDFLFGQLTEKIQGNTIGEVMEIGSESARSVYPAKFYRLQDQEENHLLPVGTKVLIIDFDEQGIALVVQSKNIKTLIKEE